MIFGPCRETSKTAITLNPESNFTRPREESFPIPLKYIDVTRTTHTNLDDKQEKRIDDYWNMDHETCLILGQVSRILLYWKKKLPTDLCGPGERTDKKTAYIQARSFMTRNLENNGKERQAEGEAKVVE